MEWVIGIVGERYDLEELAKTLNKPDATLSEQEGRFVLRSNRFDPAAAAEAVVTEAKEILAIIDGAASLILGRRSPLATGEICRIDDDGKRNFYVVGVGGIHIGGSVGTVRVTQGDGTVQEFHQAQPVPMWLTAALADNSVAKVLRYLSGPLDWRTLYNIHEAIKIDMGSEGAIETQGWATGKEQNRFTHTANNYNVLREEARHSREDWLPPANPMSISEATSFVKTIAHGWLNYKSNN